MQIHQINLSELTPYDKNPRLNDDAVPKVAESIRQFGFKVPIVIDSNNVIVAGHTRYKAAQQLGIEQVPCIIADDLSPEQIRAYRLADNKVAEFAEWDFDALNAELEALADFDMLAFGFDEMEDELEIENPYDPANAKSGSLVEKYVAPPFSVLDSRQGYWKDRKAQWNELIDSGQGRDEELLGSGLKRLADLTGANLTGTSVFDPVLAEVLLTWFCPPKGHVIDPFAGGSVRGLVSTMLGNKYTGVDLSEKQIASNLENYQALRNMSDFKGKPLRKPKWIQGDSCNIDVLAPGHYDFLLTCPPYADLEVYSDDPRDLSTMDYSAFRDAYFTIIQKSVNMLKEDAFAAIVVGDIRDKSGLYRNFVSDTISAFHAAGAKLYNECILVESGASAALRASRQFDGGRKVVKMHQNVLVFVKGNPKKIELSPFKFDFDNYADDLA